MRRLAWCAVLAIGCGKQLNPDFCAAHGADPRCTGEPENDAAVADTPVADAISHLDADIEDVLTGAGNVTIATATLIDTATGTIYPALTGDTVVLASVKQESGSAVMVIQAASISITSDITITGDKPLIFVGDTIDIEANLVAWGDVGRGGPGGGGSSMGDGAGQPGGDGGTAGDPGGGGGSFGTVGGAGGGVTGGLAGPAAGATYGTAATLVGGSGGGAPSRPGTCTVRGGGGGGAIQLSAFTSITIASGINVSGGGGEGGRACGGDGSGGAGGGSGGMIFLEAPMLLGAGTLAANGGGGGEGSSTSGSNNGVDGAAGSLTAGGAGGASGNSGGDAGDGATGTESAAAPGANGETDGNGGGGGGGAGRIYMKTSGPAPSYTTSPPATTP